MTEVSVIMATYKEPENQLRRSIESILNQTYKAFEYIIILDNPRFLQRRKLWTEQSLQAGMDFAAEGSKTEILSIFMDIRKDQFPKKKKTFEL